MYLIQDCAPSMKGILSNEYVPFHTIKQISVLAWLNGFSKSISSRSTAKRDLHFAVIFIYNLTDHDTAIGQRSLGFLSCGRESNYTLHFKSKNSVVGKICFDWFSLRNTDFSFPSDFFTTFIQLSLRSKLFYRVARIELETWNKLAPKEKHEEKKHRVFTLMLCLHLAA